MLMLLILIFSVPAYSEEIRIAACIYDFKDAFMNRFRKSMAKEAEISGIKFEMIDSMKNQNLQFDQVEDLISEGVSALIINPVNRMDMGAIIEKAKDANIPIVFINREPVAEDLNLYDRAYYVGSRPEEAGTLSGLMIAEYFKAHPEADKNNDGKIQFVMLKGENGHQDMYARSKYSVEAISEAGYDPVEVASAIANWDKFQAMVILNGFVMSIGAENIEAIIANNDEMALGAVETLKSIDYNKGDPEKFIPIVGVDGNAGALLAINDDEMIGTVLQDAETQGACAVKLALTAAKGLEINAENIGYEISKGYNTSDNKYIWIPYQKITKAEKLEKGE